MTANHAKKALQEAGRLIETSRANSYGSVAKNHENIARLWDAYMHNKHRITAEDVANMMELLKIARRKLGVLHEDNYIDGAGYAAVALECAHAEAEEDARKRK
jgi:hypothetical protein|tara:strand:- start:1247 stop:1555 length:309 start_codon:yes stop_codon:yes gene_type:complete